MASNSSITSQQALGNLKELNDISGQSIRGSTSLVLSEISCNIFRLVGTVIMARLLSPEHFGLLAMVTVLTSFAEMFKDLGLGTATIQKKEITHAQVSTLFWINAGIGMGLMAVLAASAPILSWFYEEPRLFWVTLAISSTFLFGGLTIQHQALLQRQMRFPQLALTIVLATGLSTIIGIILAWLDFEYWALVWKEVARPIIQAVGVWMFCRWIPGLPAKGTGVRTMFQTGSHITGFNLFLYASNSLGTVLLGKLWGAMSLGIFKQASLLLSMPGSLFSHPITSIMTPALSALQTEPERYRNYYKKVLSLLAFGYVPLVTYMAVYAENLTVLMLGNQWIAAAPLLQILACAVVVQPMMGTCGTVMITCGKTGRYFNLGVMLSILSVLSTCVGIVWGAIGLAWSVVAYMYISSPFVLAYGFKDTPVSPELFYDAIKWPAIASGAMAVVLLAVHHLIDLSNLILELGCSAILAPLAYCAAWLLLPNGKEKLSEFLSHFKEAGKLILSKVGFAGVLATSR